MNGQAVAKKKTKEEEEDDETIRELVSFSTSALGYSCNDHYE